MPKKHDEQISHLLDGRLSAENARVLRARIDADPELYARYKALKSARDMVRADAGITQLPQGFDARLRRRLQSEELKLRAETRARAELPHGRLVRRAAIALTGVAAGVAMALALGPMVGLKLLPDSPDPQAEQRILPPHTIGVDFLEPIVNKRLESAHEIERLIAGSGPTLDPAWLDAEMRLSGLHHDTQDLEDALELAFGPRARTLEEQLRNYKQCVATLSALTQQSLRRGETLSSDRILPILADLDTSPHAARRASQPEMPSLPAANLELDAYLRARKLYAAQHYLEAKNAFADFRHDWPSSNYRRHAVLYMARSQIQSGFGADAVDLLDAASTADPLLLNMLSADDLENLGLACGLSQQDLIATGGLDAPKVVDVSTQGIDFGKPESLNYWFLKRRWLEAQDQASSARR